MDAVIETVVQKLGYREVKNLQTKSIKEFVSGNDVFNVTNMSFRHTRPYISLIGYVINSHIPLAQQ